MIKSVELHITNACTHKCPYCYMNANMNPEQIKYSDFKVLEQIIKILKKANVEVVALLGGDPVRHPDIIEILQLIHNSGIKTSIMSNTMDIYERETAASLIDNIDATFHGRSAEEHDAFCGCKGAFELLLNNLKFYNSKGVNVNIAVNITPQTYDKVYDIVKSVIIRDIKVDAILTQRILPNGRALGTNVWFASAEQVNIAFSQAVQAKKDFGVDIGVEDPYPFCVIEEEYHQYMHGCPEGKTRLAIGMNGEITKCGADPYFSPYNILEDSLDYIWNKSDLFSDFREKNFLPEECKACKYLDRCGGGCPISCQNCTLNMKKIWSLGV
ncbi:MAG: radical SAM protein [Lachnospiraceae bacterium]|nr:radical SAM protein [Lachnospiraceae bacterium]